MAGDLIQIHLAGPEHSGRGVRLRHLLASEVDEVTVEAARIAGTDGQKFVFTRLREGVGRMVVQVTGERDLPNQDAVLKATWKPVTVADLNGVNAASLAYDALFTAKDDSILCQIFNKWHSAAPAEVDLILGKALPVSGG